MSARKLPATAATVHELFGPQAKRLADLRSLPFVVDREPTPDNGARRMFWRDANTEDRIADELLGGAWARRFLDYRSCDPGGTPLLPWIVRDMMRVGAHGGVEIGFLCAVETAASGRTLAGRVAGGGP